MSRACCIEPAGVTSPELIKKISSAFAIVLFVTVFGLASIYVKALNRVKGR